jgi:plastocyanin
VLTFTDGSTVLGTAATERRYQPTVSPASRSAALALAAIASMAAAASAQAATRTVYMGVPPKSQKAFAKLHADVNAYFPRTITVRRGDKVRFLPVGFHTVDLPAKGAAPDPLVSPGAPIAGKDDAAGVPYWFNGQPALDLTPSLLGQGYGRSFAYNGKTAIRSGLPFSTKPMTVKFTKTGSFTYYCNIHSGMKGRVRVIRGRAPSAKAVAKSVKRQVAAGLKDARKLQTTLLPKNTIQIGNSSRSGVDILAFFPGTLSVAVGTTVTFTMPRFSLAAHTATTGPGNPLTQPDSFLGRISASIRESPTFDQAGVYPSDERGVPALLTPALHGNGFWSSGFMDRSDATPQPKTSQVKIVAPGTYTFYCMLHPFMTAVVTAS